MRKIVAPVIGILSLLAPAVVSTLDAAPASAHPGHGDFVEWRSPEDGQEVSGRAVHIKARVSFGGDGVKSYTVEVLAPAEASSKYPGFGTICEEAVGGSPLAVDIDCPWDTTVYPDDASTSWNGEYVVRVSAVNGTNRGAFGPKSESHQTDRPVMVLNTVSPPQNVHLSFSEPGRQANVDWDANPEPDVTSYTIQERVGDQAWKTVGQAGARITSFTRQLSAPGTYRYQVAAIRASGTDAEPVQSAWSGPSGEPKQIVVAEPARPATTSTSGPDAAAEPFVPGTDPSPGPPAEGGPGAPLGPAGAPDGAPRGEAGRPVYSSPGNLVTRIQPGSPGSVDSRQASGGNLVDHSGDARGAAPADPDEPFSEQLPYKKPVAGPPATGNEGAGGIAGTLVSLPRTIPADSRRDLAVPLAAGLLLFVFAMHALYLSRRSAPDAPLDLE
jgi:hypothetical protein